MSVPTRVLASITALLAIALATPAAQDASSLAQRAEAQEGSETLPTTIAGELLEVDTEGRTFMVRTGEPGAEETMTFRYDDQTEVLGAREGTAGLATMAGARVTVEYTDEGEMPTATRIQVIEADVLSPR